MALGLREEETRAARRMLYHRFAVVHVIVMRRINVKECQFHIRLAKSVPQPVFRPLCSARFHTSLSAL